MFRRLLVGAVVALLPASGLKAKSPLKPAAPPAIPDAVSGQNRVDIVTSCMVPDRKKSASCIMTALKQAGLKAKGVKGKPVAVPVQDRQYDLRDGLVLVSARSETIPDEAKNKLFRYNSFVTRKDVDADEDWKTPSGDRAPDGYALCGYKISEASNINSSWRTKEIGEDGYVIQRRVLGQGFGNGGGSLHLGVTSRFIRKDAAEYLGGNYSCESDGYTMRVVGNSRIQSDVSSISCVFGVQMCTYNDPASYKRSTTTCGVCFSYGTSW